MLVLLGCSVRRPYSPGQGHVTDDDDEDAAMAPVSGSQPRGDVETVPASSQGGRGHRGTGDTQKTPRTPWSSRGRVGHAGRAPERELCASRVCLRRVQHARDKILRGQTCQTWSPLSGGQDGAEGWAKRCRG